MTGRMGEIYSEMQQDMEDDDSAASFHQSQLEQQEQEQIARDQEDFAVQCAITTIKERMVKNGGDSHDAHLLAISLYVACKLPPPESEKIP